MSQKVKCPVCNIEYDIRGFPTHYGTKHPVEFAKSIGSQPLKAATDGASLQDSAKLAALSDSVKAKDTEIAQLQDSLTKSDAAFLTVKAELADAISYEHERAIVVDFGRPVPVSTSKGTVTTLSSRSEARSSRRAN